MPNERIAVLCDMHLIPDTASSQYVYLLRAVERMRRDGVDRVITLGDLTACGELEAWDLYLDAVQGLAHCEVIGNSDVRDPATADTLLARTATVETRVGERCVIGLSTPDGVISDADFARLEAARDGDVILLHYYLDALKAASRARLHEVLAQKQLLVLHGHAHRDFDYVQGRSHVMGFRGLDPDKASGGYPCMVYLTLGDEVTREEICFAPLRESIASVRAHLGVSCVRLHEDVAYALEHEIGFIELRCDKKEWSYDPTLTPLIEAWRTRTNGFLSVHMPNLKWADGQVVGGERWQEVLEYALLLRADHLTIHPPRRTSRLDVLENKVCFDALLAHYVEAVRRLPDTTTVGIENLHWDKGEAIDESRPFAIVPEEQLLWVDAINQALAKPGRVGCLLDTGHARNNGALTKRYPLSRWYAAIGSRAVAYHVHQSVKQADGDLKNHKPIEDWLGSMISYCGFFDAWERGILRHAPIFLEVKGWKNHEISLQAIDRLLV